MIGFKSHDFECTGNQTATVTTLGHTITRPPHRAFGIYQADRLFHQYVIGQTGTGKSTLMLQMMKQDIRMGQGFCLLDPHGDLAEQVRNFAGEKCLYWSVADPASPYGYNPLAYVGAKHRPLVVSGLIDTLKKQWSDAWGVRMEHLLRYCLLALLERRGSTLQDIMPMFLNRDFRREVVSGLTDEQVRHFWTVEFPASNRNSVDGITPIANKVGALLAHPVVRRAVCGPKQPLRLRQLMDEGKTLIVNLSTGKLGADIANVLGGLLISTLSHAALTRTDLAEQQRQPYFLYCDEFPSFTTKAFADMISILRKYRLGLILAHQYTAQMDTDVLEGIFGNMGTLAVFRVGAKDAPLLQKQLGGDIPQERDLINLPNYQMFIKLMIGGRQSEAFSAETLPI